MARYLDEDEMLLPHAVNNYYFMDENDEPICFSVLPFQLEGQSLEICNKQVFLHGITEDGLQIVYRQVTACKLDLEGIQPKIYVYSKDNKWIMLLKPRKSFEDSIRKILITIQCFHYLKKNPDSTEKSLWENVRKIFSHYEVLASKFDILDHVPFIRKILEKDVTLAKSKFLVKLLAEAHDKLNVVSEGLMIVKNPNFINDNDENDVRNDADHNEEFDQRSVCFNSVCFICDDGGELLCCEGKCLRSFHAIKTVLDSRCPSLGFTRAQVDALPYFKCLNCLYEKHQCFACGRLGSSSLSSAEALPTQRNNAELHLVSTKSASKDASYAFFLGRPFSRLLSQVFRCTNATCGHFYHPKCVARLIHKENEMKAAVLEKKIAAGKQFICPFHKCIVCKKKEDKYNRDLQFAMCRRCPTSYHRKCLPREIVFEGSVDGTRRARAWDGLLPYRILIYCMRHKIDDVLGTPKRNHLIFSEDFVEKKVHNFPQSSKLNCSAKRKAEHIDIETTAISAEKEELYGCKKSKDDHHMPHLRKVKITCNPSKIAHGATISASVKPKSLAKDEQQVTKTIQYHSSDWILSRKSTSIRPNTLSRLADSEMEKRIIMLVKKSTMSSSTLEDFVKKKSIPSTHAYSVRSKLVDKSITLGKVEGSLEAVRIAVQKVDEDDGSTENAKDVCEPELLHQIMKWRIKLAVYLAPFLHGKLYTSFGRHFTKVDKLKEIVDRLHCYIESGDMIVDFCCGANDFSVLLKEKLEEFGKTCQYRNYDIIPPKNDFNFVKKDWMQVQMSELVTGSQLIIGLNPPFGVKAALANKFINKALEFKPKLLILIAPKETERLDEKETKYTLIWEDEKELSGKLYISTSQSNVDIVQDQIVHQKTCSKREETAQQGYSLVYNQEVQFLSTYQAFYLPGTTDVNDKQMEQWNVQAPILSLWSRYDWAAQHMKIAKTNGHITCTFSLEFPVVDEMRETKSAGDHIGQIYDGCTNAVILDDVSLSGLHSRNIGQKERKRSSEKLNTHEGKKSNRIDKPSTERNIEPSNTIGSSPAQPDSWDMSDNHLSEPFEAQSKRTSGGESSRSLELRMDSTIVQSSTFLDKDFDNVENLYPTARREIPFSKSPHRIPQAGIQDMLPGQNLNLQLPTYNQQEISDFPSRHATGSAFAFSHSALGSSAMDKNALQTNDTKNMPLQRYPSTVNDSDRVQEPELTPETPLVGTRTWNAYGVAGSWRGWVPKSTAFAPVLDKPFFKQGSSGWLDD